MGPGPSLVEIWSEGDIDSVFYILMSNWRRNKLLNTLISWLYSLVLIVYKSPETPNLLKIMVARKNKFLLMMGFEEITREK